MNNWENDRIRLRGLEPADAETFYTWHNTDSEMARNLDFLWMPSSLAAVRSWIDGRIKQGVENDEIYCVIETISGDFVGMINSHHCDSRVGSFQYGVAIHRDHQRRGYAAEAICIFVRYFFEELRYQKVTVAVHGFNEASLRLHEALGFQLEGRLRRTLYTNGRYHDQLFYGMTKDEFKEKYQ